MNPVKFVLFTLALLCLKESRSFAQAGYLYTVGGDTSGGCSGDVGPATAAIFSSVMGVCLDAPGNLYVSTNSVIRKISASTGIVTHFAGNNDSSSFSGDGGPAATAYLSAPSVLVLDGTGDMFVIDQMNFKVRKIDIASGIITTYAGSNTGSASADGIPAIDAWLGVPRGMAVDVAGNLYLSVWSGVRKISTSGIITTVAGIIDSPGYSGDGGPALYAKFNTPGGLAFDVAGNLYIADPMNQRVRMVDAVTGIITTVVGNGTTGFSGDGGPATAASLNRPSALVFDAEGDMLIADHMNYRIRKVSHTTGYITTIAGTDPSGWCYKGEGTRADTSCLMVQCQLAIDTSGVIYFGNENRVSKITPVPTPGLDVVNTQPAEIILYPNPSSAKLTIATSSIEFGTYSVISSIGDHVLHGEINGATTFVNLQTIPAGIYFVKLFGQDRIVMRQFVKM